MKLGKNQRIILNKLENKSILTIDKINIKNYSQADTKRLVEQLENKGLIEIINGKLKLKKNKEYDFEKKAQRIEFFNICKLQRVFKSNDENRMISFLEDLSNLNLIEYLSIENRNNYKNFYDWNFHNNISLNKLKNKDLKSWQRIYNSGIDKMSYQIELIQKRINSWSEKKYNLVYESNSLNNERIYLERRNSSKVKLLKDTNKKLENKEKERILLEYEVVFMTYSLINELIDIAYSSKKNYESDFFSSDSFASF